VGRFGNDFLLYICDFFLTLYLLGPSMKLPYEQQLNSPLKITDFGVSRIVGNQSFCGTLCGTPGLCLWFFYLFFLLMVVGLLLY
jgi:hypothetical protein